MSFSALPVIEGVNGWLAFECGSADASSNAYLSNYASMIENMKYGTDDHRNTHAQKSYNHIARLQKTNPFREWFNVEPSNDEASAKFLFAIMMNISGNRRSKSFICSDNATEYAKIRSKEAQLPEGTILKHTDEAVKIPHITLSDVFDSVDTAISPLLERNNAMHHFVNGRLSREVTLEYISAAEDVLVGLAVKTIGFAASIRTGEVDSVPLLEPRSITDDPQVIYPFTSGFWETYTPSVVSI